MSLSSAAELQEGIASLSKGAYFKEASLDMTLSLLTESAARGTGVERVSIWALTDDQSELRCLELYKLTTGRHRSGGVLRAADYPAYFRALRDSADIAVDDVYQHPAMAEFLSDYMPQHGITATLDTPIYIRGELQGVLCIEQVGHPQPWSLAHRLFAQAVANLIALALVEYEADEARRRVRQTDERFKLLFELATEAMLLVDCGSGRVLDANHQAESLFGCRRGELTGRSRQQLYRLPVHSDLAAPAAETPSLAAEIRRTDGELQAVKITVKEAEVAPGRRLAVETILPL
ncbi:MAG: GAF domain-containing protein [Azonexus sp.]|jgi:PAS domain S-box-containing protein|nr:GAF domain-containing protein [Azonexus sp.]